MGIETAILGGTALLGLGGSYMQKRASDKASSAAVESTDKATQAQLEMFYQGREDQAPWRIAGTKALGTIENKLAAGPGEFKPSEDPGYKFGYEEFVEKPTLRMASATGKLGSGATQKALTRYASDYASTKYDNFLSRWYDSLKPYQSLAQIGQTTASEGAAMGNQVAGQIGQNMMAGGQARASGYINQGNIWGNLASGMGQNALDAYYYGGGGSSMPTWGTGGSGWGGTTAGTAAGANQMIWN